MASSPGHAAPAAPRATAAPVAAAAPVARATAPAAVPRPAAPMMASARPASVLDTILAIAAALVGIAAVGTTYFVGWMLLKPLV